MTVCAPASAADASPNDRQGLAHGRMSVAAALPLLCNAGAFGALQFGKGLHPAARYMCNIHETDGGELYRWVENWASYSAPSKVMATVALHSRLCIRAALPTRS
jgi:hypothetical protein